MRGKRHMEASMEERHLARHRSSRRHGIDEMVGHDIGEKRGRGHGRGRGGEDRSKGAQTFRRKRITMFLEQLEVKRQTLKEQLVSPELQSINPIIVGELKAVEQMISEFIHHFELNNEIIETEEEEKDGE